MIPDRRSLADVMFIASDTETTGLHSIVHRPVEIGAVRFRLNGHELSTFQQLIDPQLPIPPDVQEFLGAPDTILLAHNAPFDLGFLSMALTRLGITYPPHEVCDTLWRIRGSCPRIWTI